MERARYAEVLRRLAASEVEFIVVGMMAGVLRGAPLVTFDPLEIVHRCSAENVARLLKVLAGLDATYRQDSHGLRPGESHLMSPGHQLFRTTNGDLDCRGTVGAGKIYEALLDQAPEQRLGEGLSVRVVDLPTLIELKEQAGPSQGPGRVTGAARDPGRVSSSRLTADEQTSSCGRSARRKKRRWRRPEPTARGPRARRARPPGSCGLRT